MKIKYLLLVLAFVYAGCVYHSTIGNKFDETLIQKIKVGITTKDDVKSFFNTPTTISITNDSTEVWQYLYSEGSSQQFTFQTSAKAKCLTISFKNGLVSHHNYTTSNFNN